MSKKNVAAIVSGAGWIGGFANLLVQEMRRQEWSDEQIHALVTESKPEEQPIEKIVSLLKSVNRIQLGDTFPVTVDYTRTLADMIKAGKYDYANSDIKEKNFPIQRPSVSEAAPSVGGDGPYRTSGVQISSTDLILVHLNRVARESEILQHMDKLGLRPRGIECLLAFGEKYPDIQREFPVVAVGSRWRYSGGYWRVPGLGGRGSGRDLRLRWFGGGFYPVCRFLASSK